MNDNHQPASHSLIEMMADDENFAILCSKDVEPELVKIAAATIRTNKDLWFIKMQDLKGGQILAYRGERPPGERFSL
ncbi:hypothetical protein C8J35_11443 [Rhizobium sp. PP-F2F-G38]|uniref:hypothetical protein n=1 Tax=Rhizobium sp. PP-CC-3G-465 TaxID=2135648 RepID=UPI000D850C6A|nr:hypothetical protein C8J37_11539 [Rhizobium sp. PP-WC-1G-195]PYE39517.1 hypothetical protein DFI02_12523 [Rhizobium sp. PP-F2F-G20b]PYE93321.1 hypothetical protein C8J35_11443 [Rhizobium sp. PP-F2F-G38]TCL89430.1 hypothetical protein C8J38_11345 [Rhizobium sp. PP-WC-2G-219]TCP75327.1 hypothetical protein C8J31_1334 [Rhizobium sp. PP-CC-2G-626]TCQ02552.1 hypothetical protein C8J34_11723 [Rhizobium sp. PP-F2F-G36]TCQ17231.1 hypothetical protein C8J33_11328 [Rhizobium sp. PP-CC-3G-465]